MFEKQLNIKVKSIKVEVRLNETDKPLLSMDSFRLYTFLNLCNSKFQNKNLGLWTSNLGLTISRF